MYPLSRIRRAMRHALISLNTRGLSLSSKWLSEQLIGMVNEDDNDAIDDYIDAFDDNIDGIDDTNDECLLALSKRERDVVYYAMNLMQHGEYPRCAHALRHPILVRTSNRDKLGLNVDANDTIDSSHVKSNVSQKIIMHSNALTQFLASYSLYLAGEKMKEQSIDERDGYAATERANQSKSNQNASRKASASSGTSSSSTSTAGKGDDIKKLYGSYHYDPTKHNPYLHELFRELYPIYHAYVTNQDSSTDTSDTRNVVMDGYLMFLFGVIVQKLRLQGGGPIELLANKDKDADVIVASNLDLLLESVKMNPWNWSCWLELANVCIAQSITLPSWDEISRGAPTSVVVSGHIMFDAFMVHLSLEKQDGAAALQYLQPLLEVFPNSTQVASQVAMAHYSQRDYDQAQAIFEEIRTTDPYRLQNLETYSNILYVKEKRAELSHLAHTVVKINKYTPECCCVIGNYYSLKAQHERAILYFQRALKLNPSFLSVWTLMGHEYVELRNTSAAVQCYRRAVDESAGDYRAWYGLGQAYEMLHLYQYAIYYYKKAAFLKPGDARMWCAVGNCFGRLGWTKDAVAALERAVAVGDMEGVATRELARLYRETGQPAKAAASYCKHLQLSGMAIPDMTTLESAQQRDLWNETVFIDAEKAEGCIFLATYYRSNGSWPLAEFFCLKLMEYVGPEGDEARAMVREMRSFNAYGASGASSMPMISPVLGSSTANDANQPATFPTASSPGFFSAAFRDHRFPAFGEQDSAIAGGSSGLAMGFGSSILGGRQSISPRSPYVDDLDQSGISGSGSFNDSDRRMSTQSAISTFDARAMGELSMSIEEDAEEDR